MGCGYFTCSRNALITLNILYILIAILLIGVAAYAKFLSLISSWAVLGAIIGCGVFLLLLACMGFIGAVKHHQICLFFYMVVLFLLFLVQFSTAVALLAVPKTTTLELAAEGWNLSTNETKQKAMKLLDCCGFYNWSSSEGSCPQTLACCSANPTAVCCGGEHEVPCHCTSCYNRLDENGNTALMLTGGVGLFISFTEIIGVWLSLRFRNQKDPRADPDAFL